MEFMKKFRIGSGLQNFDICTSLVVYCAYDMDHVSGCLQ